jgi:3-oxoadipate enol-lactonase
MLHHLDDGPENGPVVVLIHAIGTSMRMWDPQVKALARAHRVMRLDLRGHGRSPVPPGPYAIADLADDVVALLDHLDVERASICGLSLGGMVGLWMAANAPERVDRLVAACVVAKPVSPAAWNDRAAAVRSGGPSAVSDLVVERWGYGERDPEIARLIREMLAATPAEGYAGCCEAVATMDLRDDLTRIRASTLLLAGREDPAAPPMAAAEMATSVSDAEVRIIEGAAHLANVERPDAVTDAILQHLGR